MNKGSRGPQEQNIASVMTDSSENSEQATKVKNPF